MNPLTQVKNLQKINATEARLGISEDASWHATFKHSAYVYAGGLPFDLTEGDLVAVFAQYGEVVDVNLVRDKGTGKSKGFAFVAYEDQRSTNLAVDNLNGAQVVGRTIRVDHVPKYKKMEEEDEEEAQRKREERGVCRAFQRGECTRGAACRFSHNEQRAANTGWGAEDKKWGHDNYDGPRKSDKRSGTIPSNRVPEPRAREDLSTRDKFRTAPDRRSLDEEKKTSRRRGEDNELEPRSREDYDRREEKRPRRHDEYEKGREYHDRREDRRPRRQGDDEFEPKSKSGEDKRPRGQGADAAFESKSREDHVRRNYDRRKDSRPRRRDDDVEAYDRKEDRDRMEEKRSRQPNNDELEPKSRARRDRREGERSKRHHYDEVPPKS
ncbi:PREDICTED: zinc finger CCCH domain-containing protein 25 [Fragaria vesca subsp. vesca]|uniref:zinc finger CCCH domain-containing protein 25 n=1 Tax=Fragaria vesca subsp. vesca TaxID=101020 RepID=UPI0002C32A7A|nr:PREDICTED: zinc finger CCCH domain-containing protein 25 [Fragaria vesca subsp. vesca]